MIDKNKKPWLLEVNHTPSFCTESPLDQDVKFNLIKDTLQLINLNEKTKKKQLLKMVHGIYTERRFLE